MIINHDEREENEKRREVPAGIIGVEEKEPLCSRLQPAARGSMLLLLFCRMKQLTYNYFDFVLLWILYDNFLQQEPHQRGATYVHGITCR